MLFIVYWCSQKTLLRKKPWTLSECQAVWISVGWSFIAGCWPRKCFSTVGSVSVDFSILSIQKKKATALGNRAYNLHWDWLQLFRRSLQFLLFDTTLAALFLYISYHNLWVGQVYPDWSRCKCLLLPKKKWQNISTVCHEKMCFGIRDQIRI